MNGLTCSSPTVEYWPSVIIVWTLLHCHVCIATTLCQYNSDVPHAWLILEIIILQPSEEQEMFTDLFFFFLVHVWWILPWLSSHEDSWSGGKTSWTDAMVGRGRRWWWQEKNWGCSTKLAETKNFQIGGRKARARDNK